ncbi:MAG: BrnT family toxin [bacterium]
MHTIGLVDFEWDEEKAEENKRKHGVDFADAVPVLSDEMAVTIPDEASDEEDRSVTLGTDALGRILVVAYMWRGERIRLISARKATRREREQYEEKRK